MCLVLLIILLCGWLSVRVWYDFLVSTENIAVLNRSEIIKTSSSENKKWHFSMPYPLRQLQEQSRLSDRINLQLQSVIHRIIDEEFLIFIFFPFSPRHCIEVPISHIANPSVAEALFPIRKIELKYAARLKDASKELFRQEHSITFLPHPPSRHNESGRQKASPQNHQIPLQNRAFSIWLEIHSPLSERLWKIFIPDMASNHEPVCLFQPNKGSVEI